MKVTLVPSNNERRKI